MGTGRERGVHFAAGAGRRIDLLQVADGKGRLVRVFAGILRVKIRQVGLPLAHALDNQAHLQAPVAQMNVTDDLVAHIALHPADGLADDRRAQMPHMQRLGHVGPAIVHHNRARRLLLGHAQVFVRAHLLEPGAEILRRQAQVDKAGRHRLGLAEGCMVQLRRHLAGNGNGRLVIRLGRCQRAVALIFAQIRPVGHRRLAIGRVIARRLECVGQQRRNLIHKLVHLMCSPFSDWPIRFPAFTGVPGTGSNPKIVY